MNVENIGLSNRTTNALLKAKIKTLHSLLAYDGSELKGLGCVSKKEITDFLTFINEPTTALNNMPNYLFNVTEGKNILDYIYDLSKAILSSTKDVRLIRIIELHFGLNQNEKHWLGKVAEGFEPRISRERARQLEEVAIETIRKFLLGGYFKLPPKIINEAQELRGLIKERGTVVTEDEIIRIIENYYSTKFNPNKINELYYVLALFQFELLPNYIFGLSSNVYETWRTTAKIDRYLLVHCVTEVRAFLRDFAITANISDIKIHLNKKRKDKINASYIEHSLRICKDIEKLGKDKARIKFEYLSNLADKAYRILHENKKPMHINDLLKEINHLLVKSSNNTDVLSQSLRGEILSDKSKRFGAIGLSSTYYLTHWGNIVSSSITGLIEECLRSKNRGTSVTDIFAYVKEKRHDAKKHTVYSILSINKKFVKVGNSIYELSEWGSKPYVRDQVMKIHEVSRIIRNYFVESSKRVETAAVLKKVIEREFNIPYTTFYKILKKLPLVRIEKKKNTKSLIVHYIGNVDIVPKINL